MQSSGASMLAFTLAQKPDSLAFIDIWNMFAAPEIETERHCVAKAIVTTAFSLEVHQRRFRPDVTLLFLRHPVDTYDSLFGKSYANEGGLIDEKFAMLEEVFAHSNGFDRIVYYEDFVFSPRSIIELFNRIGWQLDFDALLFRRTAQEIDSANAAACPGIRRRLKYGTGNIQAQGILRDRVRFSPPWGKTAHLPRLCPSLFEHYAAVCADRGELWHVPSRSLLSCELGTIMRELTNSSVIPEQSERAGYRLQLVNGTPQCEVIDDEILLCPTVQGRETRLTVSGLPGTPFQRLRAAAYAEDPRATGTTVRIQINGAACECLGEQEFTLRHSDMRYIDLAFPHQACPITLSIGVRLANEACSTDHAGVRLQDIRLEQAVG
jgi:hypothetical protein